MNRILIVLLFSFFTLHFHGQNVIIKGIELSYSGDELVIHTFSDLITNQEIQLGKCIVDSSGNFEFNFKIDYTLLAFIKLEIYKGFIFLEPDSIYEIKLPLKTPVVFEDKINPYFQQSEFYIGITNSHKSELNYLIKQFDNKYNKYIEDNFNTIRYHGTSEVDTMIVKLQDEFGEYSNRYFQDYIYYKFASLRHLAYERNINSVTRYYLLNKALLYHNIAYMDFFNQLFSNYFYNYSKTRNGERIFTDVAYAKSIKRIKETLDNNLALANDTLKELVILKACYDECYSNSYPYSSILQTLDSLKILTKIPEHKTLAENIIKKTKNLRTGYKAPDFEVYDNDGKSYSLIDFRGKYMYINFCTNWSYVCKEELSLLKNIQKNHAENLNVITITPKEEYKEMASYFNSKNFQWPLYYFEENNLLNAYNVKVFPTYYLIDPYGKLAMSPAASPNENFEWRFFKILRSRN